MSTTWRDGADQDQPGWQPTADGRAANLPVYGQTPAVTMIEGRSDRIYYPLKRLMDLVIAGVAVIVLAPILLGIGLLIRLDSPGPAIFFQDRIGSRRRVKQGRTVWEITRFKILKFRTMRFRADERAHRAYIKAFVHGQGETAADPEGQYKLTHDARITRVGHFLRRSSLDELPQILNVLGGEMSIVGPRPVPEYEAAEYPDLACFRRLATLPGITGLWQVTARSQVGFAEMIRLDCEYVRRQSLGLDLKILLLTIPAVVSGKGAV